MRKQWLAIAVLVLVVGLVGCGNEEDAVNHAELGCSHGEPGFEDLSTIEQALNSCTERQDTGYVQGRAFTITVITIDSKPVEKDTGNAYYVMQQAAAKQGVHIRISSGFRTMAEQTYFYNCYINKNCNNGNLAARPGYSNHQSGHALDLNTSSTAVFNWLTAHGGHYGFKRTVPSEPWHWEWWGGGPGGGLCGVCQPRCDGNKMISANCGVGDCGAYGSRCVNDNLGLRCAFAHCPDKGTASFCLDDSTVGNCRDGQLTTGNCAAYAAMCSTGGGQPAHCASVFCVSSPDEVPVPKSGCFLNGELFHCDAQGAIRTEACPANTQCTVYPTAGCAANVGCPATGDVEICVDDTVVGRCYNGGLTDASPCGDNTYCSTAGSSSPRCISAQCVSGPDEAPRAHSRCLSDGSVGHCGADGSLELSPCAEGLRCVDTDGQVSCEDASTPIDQPNPEAPQPGEEVDEDEDDTFYDNEPGGAHGAKSAHSSSSCSQIPSSQPTGALAAAMLVALVWGLRRRRSRTNDCTER